MAQAVSRRPVTAEARVRAPVTPRGVCGRQSGVGTGFPPSSLVFSCQYHSTVALQTYISSRDEQEARWRSQFRNIASRVRRKQQQQVSDNNYSL
jgi:hypothetical protein